MLTLRLLAAATVVFAAGAHAQTAGAGHAAHQKAVASGASAASPMADGEVRKIDKAQGKITLKHGAIANLEMPPMTMVFKVADPKMLDRLKDGDKVRFSADRVNGNIIVTAIEAAVR
jgi:Cu(I)/Ag(I) efflux system periplasmic protein CusF